MLHQERKFKKKLQFRKLQFFLNGQSAAEMDNKKYTLTHKRFSKALFYSLMLGMELRFWIHRRWNKK